MIDELVADSRRILNDALALANSDGCSHRATVVLFSGGNDSTTVAHMFRNIADYAGHCNTGIGIEKTRQFVRDTCRLWGLPLIEKYTKPGRSYRDLVLGDAISSEGPNKGKRSIWYGFPGPGGHGVMYENLKAKGLRAITKDLKRSHKDRIVFISGIRETESKRRKNRPEVQRMGAQVWANPILHWTKMDLSEYRSMHDDIPINEVSATLHMSGECLCGAFAHAGELDEIAFWYPDVANEIRDLEREAEARGIIPCRWGGGKGSPCEGVCNL